MAGSILGQDQVKAINAAYPRLLAHLRSLLASDRSGYGLMKIHGLVETLDTTELFKIFQSLTFISPAEKRALIRAAIYEVLVSDQEWVRDVVREEATPVVEAPRESGAVPLKEFTPGQFRLNVATTESLKEVKLPDVPLTEGKPSNDAVKVPAVFSKIAGIKAEADARNKEAEEAREVAVEQVRSEPA